MSVTDTGGNTSDPVAEPDTSQDKPALSVTRRNFLIGAGAGAAAAGVVLGGAVKLHPIVVVIGVLGGAILFGPVGMLFAIPTITVFKVFVSSTARQLKAYGII